MIRGIQMAGARSVSTLSGQRRAWNASAVSLTLALLGPVTCAALLFLPNAHELTSVFVAVTAASVGNGVAYLLVRSGHTSVGALTMIGVSLVQHVVVAAKPDAALVMPFFASIFVLIGAACLPARWLLGVFGLATVTIALEGYLAGHAGVPSEALSGSYISAAVVLVVTAVVAWLHTSSVDRAFELAADRESEREMLSMQLEKSARMEALGRLASGVAHDFNNLLVVMQGSAELASDDLPKDHPAQEELEQIQQAATRAAALTSQLLAFSKRQLIPPARIRPEKVVRDLEPLLKRLLGARMSLSMNLDNTNDSILASSTQLEQVILNLAANARDATGSRGTLNVSLTRKELRDGDANDLPRGSYIEIAVADTGSGIPEEVMAHLFEPFFTTKEAGRGTGLGLATCFGIVNQMGGTITVESVIQRGSTFRVYIPVSEDLPRRSISRIKTRRPATKALVIDDDATVRQLVSRILTGIGIQVLEAHSGKTSLDVAEGEKDLDLIVTDVVLGTENGINILDKLRALHPDARLVVISGYSPDKTVTDHLTECGATFLSKPFSSSQLTSIAQGLDSGVHGFSDNCAESHASEPGRAQERGA